VFDAALRRAGAVRRGSFVALFSAAKCLASRYRPAGRPSSPMGGPRYSDQEEINLQLACLTRQSRRCFTGLAAVGVIV
jgi:acetyltransferase